MEVFNLIRNAPVEKCRLEQERIDNEDIEKSTEI